MRGEIEMRQASVHDERVGSGNEGTRGTPFDSRLPEGRRGEDRTQGGVPVGRGTRRRPRRVRSIRVTGHVVTCRRDSPVPGPRRGATRRPVRRFHKIQGLPDPWEGGRGFSGPDPAPKEHVSLTVPVLGVRRRQGRAGSMCPSPRAAGYREVGVAVGSPFLPSNKG